MRLFFAVGAAISLLGCANFNTTTTDTARSVQQLWGPCRTVALQRAGDVRAAGYDEKQQSASLFWAYDDCVRGDRRTRVYSVYDSPPSRRASLAAGAVR